MAFYLHIMLTNCLGIVSSSRIPVPLFAPPWNLSPPGGVFFQDSLQSERCIVFFIRQKEHPWLS
jgi:hypothetical protein